MIKIIYKIKLEKYQQWNKLMRKDEEVMNMLARELSLYDSAVDLFEKQLLSCGIKRNGSKVTMEMNSQSRSGTSLLADAIQRKGVCQKEKKQLHLLCVDEGG
jgi:predicted transcriptional regulator